LKIIFLITIICFAISFAGPVSYYGELKVRPTTPFIDGAKIGARVQVRGVSLGWSNTGWESSRFFNETSVNAMVDHWKAEIIRTPMGQNDSSNKARVKTAIEAAIAKDVYVVIDWHSHNAHNETNAAKAFFTEMAQSYGNYDNVIFELYNEPLNAEWADIKAYAEQVIPVIREHSDNLILVGTPYYSQKIQEVIGKKIKDSNLGYVIHFYAASHNVELWQNNMVKAINDTMPLFITEYGTTHADGGCSPEASYNEKDCPVSHYNTHNAARSDAWHAFMDSRKISSVAWNINDKYEGSAFFGTVPILGGGTFEQNIPENWADTTKMTESGKYIFKKLNEYHLTAPWNPTPILPASQPILPTPGTIVEVYSLQGKKVGKDVSNLKNGVYIFLLKENGIVQTKIFRIVK